jgi:STE24 endopeptidase
MVLGIPFSIYETFVLEERFGFNKTSVKTFVTDRLKSIVLMVLLGSPILSAVLWFFASTGANAWIYWLVYGPNHFYSFSVLIQNSFYSQILPI